jgi:DNA-binding transcriptional ArsR family regulator
MGCHQFFSALIAAGFAPINSPARASENTFAPDIYFSTVTSREHLTRPRRLVYLTIWLCNEQLDKSMANDQLSATFAALADPTRRAILARLVSGEASVTELAEPFEMSLPAISKHLRVLEQAGLIARGREAQWRPCRLEAGPLKEVAKWVEHYRRFWDQSFNRLDDYLGELKNKEQKHGRKQRK